MSSLLEFDEEASRRLEATYKTPDVVAQRQATLRALGLRRGEVVVDVGCGPGFLAGEMAAVVAPTGHVFGTDISDAMLELAKRNCSRAATSVSFQVADAAELPFPAGSFDVAVSTQVLEYVKDVDACIAEMHRVLKPGGRALIVDTDWDSIVWSTSDRARMTRILAAWDEHCVDPHLPGTLSSRLKRAGFNLIARELIPIFNPECSELTYSYGIAGMIARFVVGRQGVTHEEALAWLEDFKMLGNQGQYFFSLNRYLFLARK